MNAENIVRDFNILYYDRPAGRPLYTTTSWLGVPTLKCPMDAWIYQEILHRTRPDVIVEIGVCGGGSTLFLAGILDLLGQGRLLACDITLAHVLPQIRSHPRIQLLEGNSIDPAVFSQIQLGCHDRRTMVILDSDHTEKHVQ